MIGSVQVAGKRAGGSGETARAEGTVRVSLVRRPVCAQPRLLCQTVPLGLQQAEIGWRSWKRGGVRGRGELGCHVPGAICYASDPVSK